jgi:hypothetical protein
MFAVFIVIAFLSGLTGLLALMARLEPVEAPAVATTGGGAPQVTDLADQPRVA